MKNCLKLLFCLLLPASVAARTVAPENLKAEDLVTMDALGYECISASYLEEPDPDIAAIAFQVGGKLRMARTCLPDPCDRALSPQQLSDLTGTERSLARFDEEWNDYYARYADYCRRETNPLPRDLVAAAPQTNREFWSPVITTPAQQAVQTVADAGLIPATGVLPSGAVSGSTAPPVSLVLPAFQTLGSGGGSSTTTTTDQTGGGGSSTSGGSTDDTGTLSGGSSVDPAIVPVPSAIVSLAGAFGLLGMMTFWRRKGLS